MAALLSDMLSMPSPRDKGTLHFKGRDIDVFLSKFEYHADCARCKRDKVDTAPGYDMK